MLTYMASPMNSVSEGSYSGTVVLHRAASSSSSAPSGGAHRGHGSNPGSGPSSRNPTDSKVHACHDADLTRMTLALRVSTPTHAPSRGSWWPRSHGSGRPPGAARRPSLCCLVKISKVLGAQFWSLWPWRCQARAFSDEAAPRAAGAGSTGAGQQCRPGQHAWHPARPSRLASA